MDGILLAYSITDRRTFDNLDKWVQEVARARKNKYLPMVMVATNCDMEEDRQVPSAEGQEFAIKMQIPHFDTSAKLGVNVVPAIERLVRLIRIDKEVIKIDKKVQDRAWTSLLSTRFLYSPDFGLANMKNLSRKARKGSKMQLYRIMIIDDTYRRQCIIDDQPIFLELLDPVPYPDFWEQLYFRDLQMVDGILLAYSITDRLTFDNLDKWVQDVARATRNERFPMVMIATKSDMEHDRQVLSAGQSFHINCNTSDHTSEESREFATKMQIPHFDTSAKLGVNIDPAVEKLVRLIRVEKEVHSLLLLSLHLLIRLDRKTLQRFQRALTDHAVGGIQDQDGDSKFESNARPLSSNEGHKVRPHAWRSKDTWRKLIEPPIRAVMHTK
ncbi:17064_t:CDS:2 [Acaulospora colombiana]|uniref:17064_t:CDS:1 n=1 Tax=Acaulospora colombiana TaxID=27376 RepID=A0ACA9NTL8_9GLOM|nr:17064_t:CDS:2 [Acaulospora colombiana]